jgi:hypothetical protein
MPKGREGSGVKILAAMRRLIIRDPSLRKI